MGKKKFVYAFAEGKKELKELLGGKGSNLAEMTSLGIPVPPGFTLTTEACDLFLQGRLPDTFMDEVLDQLALLEGQTGRRFGDDSAPLLVSVRSGAAASMPGMMDTILNLGLNDDSVQSLAETTRKPRFAWDSYRRLIQMFGNVVLGVDIAKFEDALRALKAEKKAEEDTDLTPEALQQLVKVYKSILEQTGKPFPQSPREQLMQAIHAVFSSWNNDRAITYRRIHGITGLKGTAVNVQAMVFGNLGDTSGTGVCFTRNPASGENTFYGEFLMNAQGEDVVAGIRTPLPISELQKLQPRCYHQLITLTHRLEAHYRDMQDIEFTIEEGRLYILQTRTGKRTPSASIRIAVELVKEQVLSREEALLRIDPEQVDQILHKQLDPVAKLQAELLTKGLPASPGAAVGQVVFSAQRAHDLAEEGKKVILVRAETSPEDIEGMHASVGILTARGGMTSHAAVVARGMGKCCVVGASELAVHADHLIVKGVKVRELDTITLDGSTGEVFRGRIRVTDLEVSGHFAELMSWADEERKLAVRTNADTPLDAKLARDFGAEGIGLCRTEHMFFEQSRIRAIREMILASDVLGRERALSKLLPFQKADFRGIFKAMEGLPVTIRLLDPPLHEFLPEEDEDIAELAESMGVSVEKVKMRIEELREMNPMLGHRGCRLLITYPEIARMQVRAILSAAAELAKEGKSVRPEIMIPLVGMIEELNVNTSLIDEVAKEVFEEVGKEVPYTVGTMIEVPRGALLAGKLAKTAQFFSFGTNDLTQMTYGFSRDDAGRFIREYLEKGLFSTDPFQSIDQEGVGELMRIAVREGRKTRADLKIGICGEQGGEPRSVEFCHSLGLDYVSCSPYRVPVARLVAAQAALKGKK